jgi:hypothetical protein
VTEEKVTPRRLQPPWTIDEATKLPELLLKRLQ